MDPSNPNPSRRKPVGELEKYGILSVGSVLVLFLVLSFRGGMPAADGDAIEADAAHANLAMAEFGVVLGSSDFVAGPDDARAAMPRGREVAERKVATTSTPQRDAPAGASDGAVSGGPSYHVIASGDTLSKIAERYLGSDSSWQDIVAVNNGLDPKRLQVGQRLLLPAPRAPRRPIVADAVADKAPTPDRGAQKATTRSPLKATAAQHKIESGDTLSGIAKRYYSDARLWKRVFDANRDRLSRSDKLPVGTILVLP